VRLEPLREQHAQDLAKIAVKQDWSLMLYPLLSKGDVEKRIKIGMAMEKKNEEYAFAVVLKNENRIIGSTSYLTIVPRHKRAEIGSTWYSSEFQGTFVNPECKFLLLKHAFEDWAAVRVQLGTDANNIHSQRAILKLGAKFEGRLRNHGIKTDGTSRDAMLYSIISPEWPEVKARLISRINNY
jgi:RimJ/RimL family protein N-acetyltransferase